MTPPVDVATAYVAALDPREVVASEAEEGGHLTKFTCGHIVWFAIATKPGDRFYCSVCVDGAVNALRTACAPTGHGIEAAIAEIEGGRV